jgi:hypothetical protein
MNILRAYRPTFRGSSGASGSNFGAGVQSQSGAAQIDRNRWVSEACLAISLHDGHRQGLDVAERLAQHPVVVGPAPVASSWVPRISSKLSAWTFAEAELGRRWAVALTFLYLSFAWMLQLFELRRSERDELAVEVIMLRHGVAVLRRRVARPHRAVASGNVHVGTSAGIHPELARERNRRGLRSSSTRSRST